MRPPLTAITAGDVATVDSILSPTYRHVNANGEMLDRAREIATASTRYYGAAM